MKEQLEALIAYLRGRRPIMRTETPEMYAAWLDREVRPLVEAQEKRARKGASCD